MKNVIVVNDNKTTANKALEELVMEVHLANPGIWEDTQYISLMDLENDMGYLPKLLVTNISKDKCFMLSYEESWSIRLYDIIGNTDFALTGKLRRELKEPSNNLSNELLDLNFSSDTIKDLMQILSRLNLI